MVNENRQPRVLEIPNATGATLIHRGTLLIDGSPYGNKGGLEPWRKACEEQAAIELERLGLLGIAESTKLVLRFHLGETKRKPDLDNMINYATPGYATSVFVSAEGVRRIRTTAESHRRIAIVEVMGRHSGYIALGSAFGQPDIILVPEHKLDVAALMERVWELYELQKNVVIVCGEGICDSTGVPLGAAHQSTDPAGNIVLSGASETLRHRLIDALGDGYFRSSRRAESASQASPRGRSAATPIPLK